LPLALQGCLRGENLLGQVPRRVRLGRWRTNRRDGADGHRLATLQAEARGRGELCATRSACECEARSALEAELRLRRILLLAARTFHVGRQTVAWSSAGRQCCVFRSRANRAARASAAVSEPPHRRHWSA